MELNGLNDVDHIFGTYSNLALTKGEVNDEAIGHYINFQQVAADTEINNLYYIHAKNDSLSVTGEKFFIKDETGIPSQFSNKLVLNAYGSGTFTGTATQRLAVDTNGNVIEIPIGSGPVDGSGTANYTARWTDSDTLSIGALYDNGTQVGIGTNNPDTPLHVVGNVKIETTGSVDNLLLTSTDATLTGAPDISLFADTAAADGDTIGNIQFRGRNGMVPGSTAPLTYAAFYSHIIDKDNNQSILALTGHKGNGSGANKTVANFSVIGTNNSGEGAVLINPSSGYTPSSYNLEVNGDFKVVDDASFDSNVGVTGSVTANSFIGNLLGNVNGNVNGSLVNGSLSNIISLSVTGTGDSYFAGNVGIGTTSPGYKLEVSGNSLVTGTQFIGDTFTKIQQAGGNLLFSNLSSSGGIEFRTNSTEKMRILANGNVGIGTTSPSYKLHIAQGEIGISNLSPGFTNPMGVIGAYNQDANNGGLLFKTIQTSTVSERMRILANGNVWIGTTNPTKKLHVNGEAFFQNTVSLPDNAYIGLGSSFDFHLSHNGSSSSITNSTGNLNISSNGGDAVFNTASTERLRITSSGNVGIGTTSPGSTLPADSETATKALQLTGVSGSAGDTAVLLRSSDNSSGLDLWHNASTGDSYIDNRYSSNQGDTIFRIKTAGTPLEALRITGDGNVGIGTTSPSEKLEVVGTIKSNQVDAFAENIPSRIGRSTGQHLSLYGNSTGNYLIGVGNKNTIIGRSGQGRIVFRNDGIQFSTEATQTRSDLFIEVINGYVGVGTSSPSQKLEVAGNILVRGSNDSADGLHLKDRTFVAFSDASSVVSRFRSSAAGIFQFQDGSYNTNIVLNTNGNSYLNGGNVGIGTTTPGAKLSVNGNVKIEGTNSLLFGGSATVPIWAISSNGSDLLIDDQASNIGSVLFNNNEGVALPRLTTTQINAISSPAQGLMAYNTTLNTICFYNGSSWQKVNHANM